MVELARFSPETSVKPVFIILQQKLVMWWPPSSPPPRERRATGNSVVADPADAAAAAVSDAVEVPDVSDTTSGDDKTVTTHKLETECLDLVASLLKQLLETKLPDDGLRDVNASVCAAMASAAAATTNLLLALLLPRRVVVLPILLAESRKSCLRQLRLLLVTLHPLQWRPFPLARRWHRKFSETTSS
jgi:hypothetical protein